MHAEYGILSVLPSALAIGLALWKKRVLPALLAGVLAAQAILAGAEFYLFPIRAADQLVKVAGDPGNFGLILFSITVGALLKLIQAGRGFEAFASAMERTRRGVGRAGAFTLNFLLGGTLFIETYSNVLITGAALGPMYDRLHISRERLAYFAHTIGITFVSMILINTWGAFYAGLLTTQGVQHPFELMLHAVPFMLYGWCSLLVIVFVMMTGLTIGPMRAAERAAREDQLCAATTDAPVTARPRLMYFVLPIGVLLFGLIASLYFTGHGDLTRGDGTASGVYAVLGATATAALLLAVEQKQGLVAIEEKILAGMTQFFEVGILIVLALAIGAACRDLGTGHYLADVTVGLVPQAMLPAMIFVAGAVMSFATGTSYGTFSIMVPIALPIAASANLDPALLFGACIAGGVFGDNCSPISDTSIVTAMGAGTRVIDHVRTQLPYALIAAALATIGYCVLGLLA